MRKRKPILQDYNDIIFGKLNRRQVTKGEYFKKGKDYEFELEMEDD